MGAQNEKATIDLVINGKQAQATTKELTAAYVEQRKVLYQMAETDPGYAKQKKLVEDLMRTQQARIVKLNEEKTAWERFATSTTSVMAGFVGGDLISTGISKIGSAISSGIQNYRAFDAASKDLSAVTGATGQDLAYLNQQAANMGPTFGKTGAEMLEAYKLMASAKPELLDQKELLVATTEAALTLAQAGKIDLATATKVTAESLNQFGEGADQANRYINVIAAGAKEGSAEINEMGAALKNSGTVAAAQNVSFEQSNAVLQSLSSIALKGGEAGTALRNVLLTLGAGSDDTNPRVVGLDKALENLGKKNLSTAEMTKLFGKENITAAQHIITHREEIAGLTEKVTGTSEAFSQAAKNNESFDHKMEVFNAKMTKLATILGTAVIPAITKVVELGIDLADMLSDGLTPASVEATQAFDDQRKKVGELTRNLTPLLDRHDELKKKTILNKDEQAELKKIVGQVANIVPSAVTEFDKYGNALGVNTGKARDFIKVQKELLKYNNKKAIDETDSDLAAKQKARDIAVAKLNLGKTQERDLTSMGGAYKSRTMTDDERRAMQADIQKLNGEIKDLEARKSGLTGSYLDTPASKPAAPATGKPATGGGGGKPSGESDDEKKAREKEERKAEAKVTANKKAELAIEEMQVNAIKDEQNRELAHAKLKADREKEEVRTSAANADKKKVWIKGIEDALVVEKIKIEEKYTKKKNEEQEKQLAATLKAAESELAVVRATEQAKIDEMVASGELTEAQGKVAKLTNEETYLEAKLLLNEAHYQALDELYKKDAEKKALIDQQKKDATAQVNAQITENEGQQAIARKDVGDAEVKQNAANTKQQAADQKELNRRKKEIFDDGTAVLKGFFKENTVIYKAAMIAQQAWALGEVAVNYSRSVMASIAGAAGIPFPGNLVAIAKSLAIPTLQAAAATANIRKQKFDAPQFAAGGFTDTDAMPSGFTGGPTYYSKKNFVAGEAGTEWIMSAPMLQNPLFANLAGAMQALQASGQYKNIGTGGGGTSTTTSQGGSSSDGILLAIHQQLIDNNEKMEQIAKRPINYDYFAVQDKQDEVARINTETTL